MKADNLHNFNSLTLSKFGEGKKTIQFNSIQFILRLSDPRGVLDPQDIEHVN
jgi:hypothetical protein